MLPDTMANLMNKRRVFIEFRSDLSAMECPIHLDNVLKYAIHLT